MVTVTEQYDAYPYPARDPAEEAKRLVVGSPSRPAEMDHFLWGGRRDWTQPLRVLVAGGGSGDGTVQLAQMLTDAGRPYEITYLDLSAKAREVAEARIAARGLGGVTFHTASLLDAPDFGTFDYIDCCGVLHHLPEPDAGFAALARACAPEGGMGMMVYAPYGRSGVYPLQEAFGALLDGLPPEERLAKARAWLDRLPDGHPFKTNPRLVDHRASDAGFYDLLLHGQDRAYDVADLLAVLKRTGWDLVSFCQPGLYDPERLTGTPHELPPETAMAVAEKLRGTIKVHVAYVAPHGAAREPATGRSLAAIPHFGAPPAKLAQVVAKGRPLPVRIEGETVSLTLPRATAPVLAQIDGRRSLREIAGRARLGVLEFGPVWAEVERAFLPWGLLHYSSVLRR
ncbi:class I SAM-dependent methyltransferase [Jannaschia seohaensis]|uniref:Ubiquinone/menaquinone biosynthesis C-methylase UbiE n=1 Tax=Jannaschia seohaensis TaxID=475081 RepID=A0A2Y9C7U0_9RHOB|nr:class I SAM-dependent methyltransferase [Jannaschia seohaensis]PWJ18238.1 ubiquinone/menaquinone biosynthesis C-methylase UbiE [Jannaschia seohaensis]SSA46763.1 Ubiquinone/menaquinone biosynthesis C-methylase UbiE [Jannaschia seohaensis]